ncbi:unnamed protein product, partial [Polarella glacialis]
ALPILRVVRSSKAMAEGPKAVWDSVSADLAQGPARKDCKDFLKRPVSTEERLEEFLKRPVSSEDFWHLSAGSTSTGTPYSSDAQRLELGSLTRSDSGSDGTASLEVSADVSRQGSRCGSGCSILPFSEQTTQDEDDDQDTLLLQKICQPPGQSTPCWRRRKYVDARLGSGALADQQLEVQPSEGAHQEGDDSEVRICGLLQQRFWGFSWRWRWCVLEGELLHIYRDE